ncbi:MAG: putative maltokinase, partial [Syntrophobacteraceae bacterium]
IREYQDEKVLIAANLSRLPQMGTLDLSRYSGLVPEELLSRNKFHQIEQTPYTLTFGPYGGYLFLLGRSEGEGCLGLIDGEEMNLAVNWVEIFEGKNRETLEDEILPAYIGGCRWYGGKARQVQQLRISDMIPISRDGVEARLVLLHVEYIEGLPDTYVMPLSFAFGDEAARVLAEFPTAVVSRLHVAGEHGILYDAMYNSAFTKELLRLMNKQRRVKSHLSELTAFSGKGLDHEVLKSSEIAPKVLKADQSNTSVMFGEKYFMKLYRHPDEGVNPDLEISKFLTEVAQFPFTPPFAGGLELKRRGKNPISLGILLGYIPNQGNALDYFLSWLDQFYEFVLSSPGEIPEPARENQSLLDLAYMNGPEATTIEEFHAGIPMEMVALLGTRTAQMHLALASSPDDPAFAPERFSTLWQRSLFQSMQSLQKRNLQLLSSNLSNLPGDSSEASGLVSESKRIVEIYRTITSKKITAMRIRIHGDYHLGQLLYTGKDYIIIDFEGEPARTLGERRIKASPIRDVAGMIRSFHYAAYIALSRESRMRAEDVPRLEPWAELWYREVSAVFLRAYLDTMKGSKVIPEDRNELEILLNCLLLDKAVYELGYELNNRPNWVMIPVRGIRHLLDSTR